MSLVRELLSETQPYAWGSPTEIPRILSRANPAGGPQAELWVGAHPSLPSRVVAGDERPALNEYIARAPERVLGRAAAERFGGRLPFLLKVLAADQPLSIQCHPSRAQAEAGFLREERAGVPRDARHRSYRDRNHKPELLCAYSRFEALKGFRPLEEIEAHLCALEAPSLTARLRTFADHRTEDGLRTLYADLMRSPAEEKATIAREATEGAARAAARLPDLAWIGRLAERYPGDLGVLSPAFLNRVVLEPDEAIYLPHGELHAYLHGVGVELMASSDNVIRGGLTKKHIDVEELLATVVFRTGPAAVLRAAPAGAGRRVFSTPAPDFRLAILDLRPDAPLTVEARSSVEILLATAGRVTLSTPGDAPVTITQGRAFLIPASVPAYRLEGAGRIYQASVPPPAA